MQLKLIIIEKKSTIKQLIVSYFFSNTFVEDDFIEKYIMRYVKICN